MSELLKIILSLSLSGTLLYLILLALKPLYKNRLSKRWQYYIWLIVIARMLLPFTPETTLVGSVFEYLSNSDIINMETIQTDSRANDIEQSFDSDAAIKTPIAEPQAPRIAAHTIPSFSVRAVISKVCENLLILWAAVALALFIRKITVYQSFARFVKAGGSGVSDIEILNLLADVGETTGVKRPVELFVNPLISTPMLLGFFHPYIILPRIEVDRTELACIMRHELTHYRRLDPFYKWLVQITVCLHWFNPFVYQMTKEINKGCELSCDEAIIKIMDKDEKKAYGDTLLNALKAKGNYNDKLAAVTLAEGAEQLKERLDAIMKYKKASKITVAIMFSLTLVLAVGAAAVGAYAAAPTPVSINGNADGDKNVTPESSITPWSVMGGSGERYTYSQQGYYQGSHIFELGWNLNAKGYDAYSDKAQLTLSDASTITVSFDKSCKSEAQDKAALADLKGLVERLRKQSADSAAPLEKPLVVSVKYVGDSDLVTLAEEYYTNGDSTRFYAIFSSLDKEIQKEYCIKMIENGKNAFLAGTAKYMESDMVDFCLEKTYKEGKIALFAGVVPCLTNEQKQIWIARASHDNKNNFLAVLTR